jgi:hypothetical protein
VVILRYSADESKQNHYTASRNRLSPLGNEMGYIPKAIYPYYNYANEIGFAPVTQRKTQSLIHGVSTSVAVGTASFGGNFPRCKKCFFRFLGRN